MAAGELDERSERLWARLEKSVSEGPPRAMAPALTPFSMWVLVASLVIFFPSALVLSWFAHRHVIAATGSGLVVYHVSFWRMRVEDADRFAPGEAEVSLDGSRLKIGDRVYHLEPGWADAGRELVGAA